MQATVTGQGTLKINDRPFPFTFTVPTGPCPPETLLPEIWRLAAQITDHATDQARLDGRNVSCSKGCGACCRQMVPLSPAESRHVAQVVDALPPDRATEIRQRFASARATMAHAGLAPSGHPDHDKTAYRAYGLAYFKHAVPCPFLEDESCSIHPVRPLVCREYLVSSPPAACTALGSGQVRQIPVPVRVWAAFGRSQSPDRRLSWRPLIDALEPSSHELDSPGLTGPQRAEAFLRELQS